MLAAQKYAENVYYHELARALCGYGFTVTNSARGDFEIAEVAADLRERFSKRHKEIDEKTRAFLTEHPEKRGGNEAAIRRADWRTTDAGPLFVWWRTAADG
jgi:hypothetical protein